MNHEQPKGGIRFLLQDSPLPRADDSSEACAPATTGQSGRQDQALPLLLTAHQIKFKNYNYIAIVIMFVEMSSCFAPLMTAV